MNECFAAREKTAEGENKKRERETSRIRGQEEGITQLGGGADLKKLL